eukprot:symbB.v1.2.025661.t1/scaffold2468.1/size78489/7
MMCEKELEVQPNVILLVFVAVNSHSRHFPSQFLWRLYDLNERRFDLKDLGLPWKVRSGVGETDPQRIPSFYLRREVSEVGEMPPATKQGNPVFSYGHVDTWWLTLSRLRPQMDWDLSPMREFNSIEL